MASRGRVCDALLEFFRQRADDEQQRSSNANAKPISGSGSFGSQVAALRGRHPGVQVVCAPAEDLPFDGDSFDATLAQLVVNVMDDPVAGLREMARVTRDGGGVADRAIVKRDGGEIGR